jgi:hypothetical protein
MPKKTVAAGTHRRGPCSRMEGKAVAPRHDIRPIAAERWRLWTATTVWRLWPTTGMACGGGSGRQRRWHAAVAPGGDGARWKIQPMKAAARRGSCGRRRRRHPVVALRDGGDLPHHVKLLDQSRPKPTTTVYGTSGRPKPTVTAATARPGLSR